MTETITIEVNANVKDAQQGMSDLRTDLKKTQKESQKTKSSFEGIGKSLGALSPQLGRITQGIGKLAESIKRLGSQTGSANGTTGQTASGLGRLGSSGALKKGIGIAGVAIAGTSLLSSILGKDNNKLAPFDKLNAVGQETILDFLRGKLPRMGDDLKSVAESAAATATATTGLLELYRLLNGIENPKPNPDPTVNGGGSVIVPGIPGDKEEREREEETKKNRNFWERFRDDGGLSMESFKNGIRDLVSSASATWNNFKDQLTRTIENIKDSLPGETPTAPDKASSSSSEKKGLWKTLTEGIADWANNDNPINTLGYEATGFTTKDTSNPISFGKALIDKATGNYERTDWTAEDVGDMIITAATAGIGAGVGGVASKIGSAVGRNASKVGKAIKDIPGLFGFAEGGVFEPNRPQLAILGDNRTEPEVAAPKSLIVEAVKEAVASMSGGNIGSMNERSREPIPITLEIDGRVLAKILYDPLNNETIRRNGVGAR